MCTGTLLQHLMTQQPPCCLHQHLEGENMRNTQTSTHLQLPYSFQMSTLSVGIVAKY